MKHPVSSSERQALGVLQAGSNLLCFEVSFHLKRCRHGVETKTTYFDMPSRAPVDTQTLSSSGFWRARPGRRARAHTSSRALRDLKSSSSRR